MSMMKKTQFELLNFLGLRIGDEIEVGVAQYRYTVVFEPTTNMIYISSSSGYNLPLSHVLDSGSYRVIKRNITYADKWESIQEYTKDFQVLVDNLDDPYQISSFMILNITRDILGIMGMELQAIHFQIERAKLTSIDNQ